MRLQIRFLREGIKVCKVIVRLNRILHLFDVLGRTDYTFILNDRGNLIFAQSIPFYRQGRTIASAKDRVTQVLVTLNPEGELVKVEVLTQSGVMDLDSAAVEAFRQAAPFPNPPKGMVEADGTIKIRWDFVLEA